MAGLGMEVVGVQETIDLFQNIKTRYADDVVYVTGTDVEYAIYLETGTTNMPPYPFLFPAMRDVARSWEKYAANDALESTEQIVKAMAFDIEAQAVKNAKAAQSQGRSPGTDPDHPVFQTGNLAGSIRAEKVK